MVIARSDGAVEFYTEGGHFKHRSDSKLKSGPQPPLALSNGNLLLADVENVVTILSPEGSKEGEYKAAEPISGVTPLKDHRILISTVCGRLVVLDPHAKLIAETKLPSRTNQGTEVDEGLIAFGLENGRTVIIDIDQIAENPDPR